MCVSTNLRIESQLKLLLFQLPPKIELILALVRKYQLVRLKALKGNTFCLTSIFFQNTLKGNT